MSRKGDGQIGPTAKNLRRIVRPTCQNHDLHWSAFGVCSRMSRRGPCGHRPAPSPAGPSNSTLDVKRLLKSRERAATKRRLNAIQGNLRRFQFIKLRAAGPHTDWFSSARERAEFANGSFDVLRPTYRHSIHRSRRPSRTTSRCCTGRGKLPTGPNSLPCGRVDDRRTKPIHSDVMEPIC